MGLSIHIWLAQIRAHLLVKMELEIEVSALSRKENEEKKDDLEGKIQFLI